MKLISPLPFDRHDAPFFFALEEYLVKTMSPDEEFFFTWTLDPCCVIGRNQVLAKEVNESYLKDHGFPVWRRPSGGGAVYADRNCVMFSFIATHPNNQMAFDVYLSKVVAAFHRLGVNAEFTGRNDLLVDGLKFSGNSFYRYKNNVVLHGSLLYDVDMETLVRAITPSDEKLISKGVQSVRQRVTNLKDRLLVDKDGMIRHLESSLCTETCTLPQSAWEEILRLSERYASGAWIRGMNPSYTTLRAKRVAAGNIEVRLDVQKGQINDILWTGDFFALGDLRLLTARLKGAYFTKDDVAAVLDGLDLGYYIHNLSKEDLLNILF